MKRILNQACWLSLLMIGCLIWSGCGDSSPTAVTEKAKVTLESRVPDKTRFETVFFLDAKRGWIGGNERLTRTEDSGATWVDVPVPFFPGSVVRAIRFTDPNHGTVLLSAGETFDRDRARIRVLNTTNGGVDWVTVADREGAEIYDSAADGSRRQWFVGSVKSKNSPCMESLVFIVEEGGAREIESAQEAFRSEGPGCGDYAVRMAFNDSGEVFLVSSALRFVVSKNGQTWEKLPELSVRSLPEMGIRGFGVRDGGNIWFVESTAGTEGIRSRLYFDGKEAWIHGEAITQVVLLGRSGIFALAADQISFVGHLKYSEDHGSTWVPLLKDSVGEVRSISQFSEREYVLLTADGRLIQFRMS